VKSGGVRRRAANPAARLRDATAVLAEPFPVKGQTLPLHADACGAVRERAKHRPDLYMRPPAASRRGNVALPLFLMTAPLFLMTASSFFLDKSDLATVMQAR
jgi:hypothetical protein